MLESLSWGTIFHVIGKLAEMFGVQGVVGMTPRLGLFVTVSETFEADTGVACPMDPVQIVYKDPTLGINAGSGRVQV
jgi:hypothetical protein